MFPKLKEAQARLDAVRKEMSDVFAEAGPDLDLDKVKSLDGDSNAKVEWIRNKNTEAEDLAKQVADLQMVQRSAEIAEQLGSGEPGAPEAASTSSFIDAFFASPAFQNKVRGNPVGPQSEILLPETPHLANIREQIQNTLFETGNGWAPESTRSGRIDLSAQEQPSVVDLVPMITTDQPLYKFMRETTFTNAATEKAEGTAFAEAALELTEQEEAIRKITVWIPVTDEQLEDEKAARAYVESRLRFMLEQKLDQRILSGDPTATPPQIRGFHNTAGINSQDATGLDTPDATLLAATKVRVTGQDVATAVVYHPNDWTDVRLMRTADGIYIWGHPSTVGPAMIWGLRVVDSAHETEGQALTGAFASQSLLVVRRGVDVQITNSHSDDFINGKQAVRADFRAALVTIRPGAFTEIVSIGS